MIALLQSLPLRPLLTGWIALRALRRNKLRSSLTALGIIIGVASVVAMVAALGQNLLTVSAGSKRSAGVNTRLGGAGTLTLADAAAIAREVPDVVAISPEVSTSGQAVANGRNWSTSVVGEPPEYLKIRDWKLASGAMFSDRDVRAAAKVAVIGSKTANQLFGALDPIGQTVRMKNTPFVIIGVLTSKGSGMGGQDQVLIAETGAGNCRGATFPAAPDQRILTEQRTGKLAAEVDFEPMKLDAVQQAAQEQFARQSRNYGRSHILADVSDVVAALEKIALPAQAAILDVATGAGHTGLHLASLGHDVICADLAAPMLDRVREAAAERGLTVETRQHAAEELPCADASFDLVTSRIAPHHFSSPDSFVRETARVLRPGRLVPAHRWQRAGRCARGGGMAASGGKIP
jgi:protein-L-isoaspartate O-methyltransferase